NIILFIGDGMGEAEIALARAYEFDGNEGMFVDTMKDRGSVIVKQLMVADPSKLEFAGSSGSGGTTISTGYRTSEERIAVKAEDGSHYKTIMEEAKEQGFKTGLVSTAIITDATPATFAAHTQNRYCFMQGLEDCLKFNETPVVEQMLDQHVDVMLGGGYNLLTANEAGGGTVHEKAMTNGYTVITKRDELMDLEVGTKTFGVFSDGHMPVEWRGQDGKEPDFVNVNANRVVIMPEPVTCEVNPEFTGMPRIEEMTDFAIKSLDNDDKGFFLMVEGASIDKQSHNAKACGTIGEMLAFDRAIKMAVEYAKEKGDTAVIVTADHGGPTQVIYLPYSDYDSPVRREHLPGLYQALRTTGGHQLNVYYGTNYNGDQSHSGVNVPIYTYGMDNADDLKGTIQQTEIYPAMMKFLFD
ncbi:MAG: alkaline phosphatase, partial [Emcibacteraceae bacterium]|nr:alkaline phosphatase [Emcibacteraceae bacterium]